MGKGVAYVYYSIDTKPKDRHLTQAKTHPTFRAWKTS